MPRAEPATAMETRHMLRFAPRYGIASPCLVRPSRSLLPTGPTRPANDNAPDPANGFDTEALLDAALRMFAAHGLSAAERACEAAEIARRCGDADSVAWWLEVCRTLDRRKAREVTRRFAREA